MRNLIFSKDPSFNFIGNRTGIIINKDISKMETMIISLLVLLDNPSIVIEVTIVTKIQILTLI